MVIRTLNLAASDFIFYLHKAKFNVPTSEKFKGWGCKGAADWADGRGQKGLEFKSGPRFFLWSPGYQTTKLHRFYVRLAVFSTDTCEDITNLFKIKIWLYLASEFGGWNFFIRRVFVFEISCTKFGRVFKFLKIVEGKATYLKNLFFVTQL